MKKLTHKLVLRLRNQGIKVNVEEFPSGAIMADIFVGDVMIVVQTADEWIGFSLVADTPDFSTLPDRAFYDYQEFEKEFNALLENQMRKNNVE